MKISIPLLCLMLLSSFLYADPPTGDPEGKKPEQLSQNPPKSLKILSWNIYMLPYFIFRKSKKVQRAKAIAEEINKSDYDILMLQEAFKHRPRRILVKRLKEKYPYYYGPVNHKALSLRTSSGLIVLSNRPLIQKGTVEFDACDSWDCMARKGAILLEGEHYGHRFQVAVTHANTGPHLVKQHQYNMIYNYLLKPNYEEGVPQIICGDMNCSYNDKEKYEAMLRIFDAEDTPLTGGRNYSNWEQTSIIDYIFLRKNNSSIRQLHKAVTLVGPDWEPKDPKTPKTNGIGLSDHYPVEIEVTFDED